MKICFKLWLDFKGAGIKSSWNSEGGANNLNQRQMRAGSIDFVVTPKI